MWVIVFSGVIIVVFIFAIANKKFGELLAGFFKEMFLGHCTESGIKVKEPHNEVTEGGCSCPGSSDSSNKPT